MRILLLVPWPCMDIFFLLFNDASRFAINFQNDSDGDNIGMHFNPRQDEEDIVLNACFGGDWGDEQRGYENDFGFRRGEFFDCFFVACDERINVSYTIQAKHF